MLRIAQLELELSNSNVIKQSWHSDEGKIRELMSKLTRYEIELEELSSGIPEEKLAKRRLEQKIRELEGENNMLKGALESQKNTFKLKVDELLLCIQQKERETITIMDDRKVQELEDKNHQLMMELEKLKLELEHEKNRNMKRSSIAQSEELQEWIRKYEMIVREK